MIDSIQLGCVMDLMHIVVLETCNIRVIFISFVTLCVYFEYILVLLALLTSLLYTGGVK